MPLPEDRCVRVLHLEDSREDAELIAQALRSGGLCCDITRVASAGAFAAELEREGWGLILADYRLPDFDGLAALALARGRRPEVPFIMVSGTIGEEAAVEAVRAGAEDYVLKDRISRLAPSAGRAVREAEERRARRDAERQVRAGEERIRLLVAHMPGLLWSMDSSGTIVFVIPNTEGLTGYPADHFAGDGTAWFASVHPEDQAEVGDAYAALRADGRTFALEYRIRHRTGRWIWVRDCGAPAFTAGGVRFSCGLVTDVTGRRRMEEQLRQAQKMEAVGLLAGGVAHDFNNLLTVIMGYADFLLSQSEAEGPSREALREMREAGARAVSLTRQLLAFSRKDAGRPRAVSWNEIVAGMERMLRRLIPANIRLEVRYGEGVWEVLADPGQLEQVLLNLAVNARDAMPDGGTLTVETGNTDEGPGALLSIGDTGVGMEEETQSRLFEPFFTTKPGGKGTGLGLTTVQGIVSALGGRVEVSSALGKGSTFRVRLPRSTDPSGGGPGTPAGSGPARGTETVLLVEDSESVRRLTREILASLGYFVLDAPDGETAESLAGGHAGRIDLLLTDAVLPGIGGAKLARRLANVRPGLRVLLMSGYDEREATGEGGGGLGVAFLQKPFSAEQLAKAMRGALEGPAR